MAVGLKLGSIIDEIGTQDFLHAFFSTVSYRLEEDGWGSRFPCLLQRLYQGRLEQRDAEQAIEELELIKAELGVFPPEKVIWDIENLDAKPPWGGNITSQITDLSNYFVTSAGRDLIGVFRECFETLRDKGGAIEIISI